MSKQEILSWTSLATSTSVVIFYLLVAFGWPEGVPDYSAKFVKFAFNAFWIAVIIEIIVQISESTSKVQKDERDIMIEGRGLKAGYSILVVAVMITLVQLFLAGIVGAEAQQHIKMANPTVIFHFLFIGLFIASSAKRVTMIYNYRKDF